MWEGLIENKSPVAFMVVQEQENHALQAVYQGLYKLFCKPAGDNADKCKILLVYWWYYNTLCPTYSFSTKPGI